MHPLFISLLRVNTSCTNTHLSRDAARHKMLAEMCVDHFRRKASSCDYVIFKLLLLTASFSLHMSLVESNGSSGSSRRDVWQHKRVAHSFKYYRKPGGCCRRPRCQLTLPQTSVLNSSMSPLWLQDVKSKAQETAPEVSGHYFWSENQISCTPRGFSDLNRALPQQPS